MNLILLWKIRLSLVELHGHMMVKVFSTVATQLHSEFFGFNYEKVEFLFFIYCF